MLIHQVELDVVELDPAVVDVARRWFEFKEDKRLRVHIGDGLQHVKDLAEKGSNLCSIYEFCVW